MGDRVYLGSGVAIQKRGQTWTIDVYRNGLRFRKTLGKTCDRGGAVMAAGEILSSLEREREKVEGLHYLAILKQAARDRLQPKNGVTPGCFIGTEDDVEPNPAADALRELALKSVDVGQ